MSLSDKIWKSNDGEEHIPPSDVKEFIRLRNKSYEKLEAQMVGLVWGLSFNTDFDTKKFNIEFSKLRRTYKKKVDKLAGDKLNGKVFSMEIKVDKSLKDNEFKLKQEIN